MWQTCKGLCCNEAIYYPKKNSPPTYLEEVVVDSERQDGDHLIL